MKYKATLLAGFVLASYSAPAQVVEAHFAQSLVNQTMSSHPELQKLGLHAIPPGKQEDEIIACSVPSKIGKKSSPADLAVEQSRKASVKTNTQGAFYDLALPWQDASQHPLGMIVMEMKLNAAPSEQEAITKAEAIRDGISAKIPTLAAMFADAPHSDPLVLLSTTKMPDIVGDFDHLAVDLKGNRLYVSAEVHHSIEVFDLKTGEHIRSAPVATTPHSVAFVPEKNELLVADGGDNSCRILDGGDLHEIKRIQLDADPDAAVYDAEHRLYYVGNGGKHGNETFSYVSIISPDQEKEIGRIKLESENLEDMELDSEAKTLYVNMRDKAKIGVLDLTKQEVKDVWSVPGLKLNTPMELDEANHRLFVAGRQPGKFSILDSTNGHLIATLDCVEKADDMTYDSADRRIYVTGSGGVTIVHQDSPDHYTTITQFPTNEGKTSVYVPSLKQFYIVHAKTALDAAGLQVYKVND